MHDHTVDLTTPLGPVTAVFSTGRLTGADVVTVSTGPGFGINHRQYSGAVCLSSPGWTEGSARLLHDATFADADGRHPFPRDRAAMVGVIRAAVADYATRGADRQGANRQGAHPQGADRQGADRPIADTRSARG